MDRNRDRDRETDPDKLEGLVRFESWVGWFRNRWPAQVSLWSRVFSFQDWSGFLGWRRAKGTERMVGKFDNETRKKPWKKGL
jgi:hypothetical protein